jgi:hypothetical protein
MREGRVGDWRERSTPGQRAVLARICGRWLAGHGYEPDAAGQAGEPHQLLEVIRREVAMARGSVACTLRCLSLRHPRLARSIKPLLGIAPEAPLAPPAPIPFPANIRLDGKAPLPVPHSSAARPVIDRRSA